MKLGFLGSILLLVFGTGAVCGQTINPPTNPFPLNQLYLRVPNTTAGLILQPGAPAGGQLVGAPGVPGGPGGPGGPGVPGGPGGGTNILGFFLPDLPLPRPLTDGVNLAQATRAASNPFGYGAFPAEIQTLNSIFYSPTSLSQYYLFEATSDCGLAQAINAMDADVDCPLFASTGAPMTHFGFLHFGKLINNGLKPGSWQLDASSMDHVVSDVLYLGFMPETAPHQPGNTWVTLECFIRFQLTILDTTYLRHHMPSTRLLLPGLPEVYPFAIQNGYESQATIGRSHVRAEHLGNGQFVVFGRLDVGSELAAPSDQDFFFLASGWLKRTNASYAEVPARPGRKRADDSRLYRTLAKSRGRNQPNGKPWYWA